MVLVTWTRRIPFNRLLLQAVIHPCAPPGVEHRARFRPGVANKLTGHSASAPARAARALRLHVTRLAGRPLADHTILPNFCATTKAREGVLFRVKRTALTRRILRWFILRKFTRHAKSVVSFRCFSRGFVDERGVGNAQIDEDDVITRSRITWPRSDISTMPPGI